MGQRSQRFALIAKDGKVTKLLVEPGPGLNASSAESVLSQPVGERRRSGRSARPPVRSHRSWPPPKHPWRNTIVTLACCCRSSAVVVYSSFHVSDYECEVCMTFEGRRPAAR